MTIKNSRTQFPDLDDHCLERRSYIVWHVDNIEDMIQLAPSVEATQIDYNMGMDTQPHTIVLQLKYLDFLESTAKFHMLAMCPSTFDKTHACKGLPRAWSFSPNKCCISPCYCYLSPYSCALLKKLNMLLSTKGKYNNFKIISGKNRRSGQHTLALEYVSMKNWELAIRKDS